MSKRATVEPRWLDSMLVSWGKAHLSPNKLGYPSISPMFKERVGSSITSGDPVGYSGGDFRELEAAINALPVDHRDAIIRAYRPWTARSIEAYYPTSSPVTWHRRLHAAAKALEEKLRRNTETLDRAPAM